MADLLDESMHDIILTRAAETNQADRAQTILRGVHAGSVLCGMLPSGDVNAYAQRVDAGYLILVTSTLRWLAGELSGLAAALMPFEADDGSVLKPAMTFDKATQRVNQDLEWCFGRVPLPRRRPEIPLTGFRANAAVVHYEDVLTFVLAHELSHIVLGHLSEGNRMYREFPPELPSPSRIDFGAIDEIDADVLAARMALALTERAGGRTRHFGAIVFFEISNMLEMSIAAIEDAVGRDPVKRLADRGRTDHPHPFFRRSQAIVAAEPDGYMARLPYSDAMLTLFEELWHGPDPDRGQEAITALEEMAKGADYARLDAVLNQSVSGIHVVMKEGLFSLVDGGVRAGSASVSALALRYLALVARGSRIISAQAQLKLAIVYTAFHASYLDVGSPDKLARDLDRNLRAAIPEFGSILELAAQVFH